MKGEQASREYYVAQSSWGWLAPLKDALKALHDLRGLWRAGFTVAFDKASLAKYSETCDEVVSEDSLAASAWRLVACLLTERASSMMAHIDRCPYALALLAADEPVLQEQGLKQRRDDWAAYSEAMHYSGSWGGGVAGSEGMFRERSVPPVARGNRQHACPRQGHVASACVLTLMWPIWFLTIVRQGFVQTACCCALQRGIFRESR